MSKKRFSKFLVLLLAMVMAVGFSVTSFASETIPVTFSIDYSIAPEHMTQAVNNGYDASVVASVQNGTYGSLTRNYTFNSTSNGLLAIQNAGNQIISQTVVTGTTPGGDTTIDKVFTLPTIDIYGTNTWTGYYWQIIINGIDEDDESVRFESPVYAASIPLGEEHTFTNIWDNENQTYSSITCTVTSLEVHYVKATYTWQ